jgi:hypothetical protein
VPQIPSVTPLNQEEKDPQSPALPAPEKALSVATEPEDGAFDEDPFDPAGAEKPRVLAARYPGPLMATPMPPKPLPNRELKKDPSGEVVTKPGAGSTKVTAEKHRRRRDLFDEMQRMKRMATQVPTRKGVSSLRKVAHLPRLTGPMQAVRV